jgi:hypothetical protein
LLDIGFLTYFLVFVGRGFGSCLSSLGELAIALFVAPFVLFKYLLRGVVNDGDHEPVAVHTGKLGRDIPSLPKLVGNTEASGWRTTGVPL